MIKRNSNLDTQFDAGPFIKIVLQIKKIKRHIYRFHGEIFQDYFKDYLVLITIQNWNAVKNIESSTSNDLIINQMN